MIIQKKQRKESKRNLKDKDKVIRKNPCVIIIDAPNKMNKRSEIIAFASAKWYRHCLYYDLPL